MSMTARCMNFAKGRHRFVFRYEPGQEARMLAMFADLAEREDSEFDWFDAAVLSYQLGKRLHEVASVATTRPS